MSINIANLNKLSELVSLSVLRKPKIILNPEEEYYLRYKNKTHENGEDINLNIKCDKADWNIPKEVQPFVDELSKNDKLSNEEKILAIYEELSKIYTYDDNVLSYIKRVDDDKFALPDWYGRDINEVWEANREEHNRRVCYEVSRYLAKSLTEIFKNNDDYDVCILWDKDLTHYFVGLTCSEYSLTLDLDDFNNIKDLTRLKTNLTAEGIKILEDDNNKFKNSLDNFNKVKGKYAIKEMETEINDVISSEEIMDETEEVVFFRNALEILKEKYNIDSQGIFEYMKEIADISLGPENREKIWKSIEGETKEETRHMRCLILNIKNQKYLIDSDTKELRKFDEKEFDKENAEFIPYKKLHREWDEFYTGR